MKKLSVLILLLALSSCAFQSYYPQTGSITYEPVAAETVKIYTGDIEEDYIILGSIAADAAGKGKKPKACCKNVQQRSVPMPSLKRN